MHVHVGVGKRTRCSDIFGISINWVRYEHVINGLISPSRRYNDNDYCRDNRDMSNDFGSLTAYADTLRPYAVNSYAVDNRREYASIANDYTRYRKLNHFAYTKYQTLETRAHQGSCNPTKIVHWLMFQMAFINRFMGETEMVGSTTIDLESDFRFLIATLLPELPEDYRDKFEQYWVGRWNHFGIA